jgi:cytochrome c553
MIKQKKDEEIGESIEDYKNGRYKQGTIEDLLADLNEDDRSEVMK